jgi:hypothetical protein
LEGLAFLRAFLPPRALHVLNQLFTWFPYQPLRPRPLPPRPLRPRPLHPRPLRLRPLREGPCVEPLHPRPLRPRPLRPRPLHHRPLRPRPLRPRPLHPRQQSPCHGKSQAHRLAQLAHSEPLFAYTKVVGGNGTWTPTLGCHASTPTRLEWAIGQGVECIFGSPPLHGVTMERSRRSCETFSNIWSNGDCIRCLDF